MKISIATLFAPLYQPFLATSLVRRAQEQGLIDVQITSLFDVCAPKERVDGPTFGHASGMVIRPEVVERIVTQQEECYGKAYKIFFSPDGKKLDQPLLRELSHKIQEVGHMMLLPARYEGMDARIEQEYADCVISLGDFVLMGGDLPAMVLMEGLLRLIPGVVGKQDSVEHDSFTGAFVDYKHYTHPVEWHSLVVPEVIRSGNHAAIENFQKTEAVQRTVKHHFEWLRSHAESSEDRLVARQFIPSHYAILMHDQVVLEAGREGTSSVTSLDIHDIARSARTFGIKKYFIVTPLVDQQKIIRKLLEFWNTDVGINYNPSRHQAVSRVELVSSLAEAQEKIAQYEGQNALLLATAARKQEYAPFITYYDQEQVWGHNRPVALLFGTARGLAPSVLSQCDYILEPIEGFSDFNHLSVRSAAAIIFDRWLGINIKR